MFKSNFVKCVAAFMAMCAIVVSCKKEAVVLPEIKIDDSEIGLMYDGGRFTAYYEIVNPKEGAKLVASSNADWLKVTVTDEAVVLDYDMNKGEEDRVAEITVYYPEAEQITIVATQIPRPVLFNLELLKIEAKSVDVKITPANPMMKYIVFCVDKEYYSQFTTEEEVVADDMAFLQEEIEYGAYYGMSAEEVLAEYTTSDVYEGTIVELDPDTDYVVYVYGVNSAVSEAITKIVTSEFRTTALPPKQMIEMTFDISVKEEENHSVTYTVKATPADQVFYAGIIPAAGTESMTEDQIAEILWAGIVEESGDYFDQYWDMLWPAGEESGNYADLEPSTEYMIMAFGIDKDYGVISKAKSLKFTSPAEAVVATRAGAEAKVARCGAGFGVRAAKASKHGLAK